MIEWLPSNETKRDTIGQRFPRKSINRAATIHENPPLPLSLEAPPTSRFHFHHVLVNEAGPKRKRKESRWREGARGGEEEEDATKACASERRREGRRRRRKSLKAMGRQKSTVLKAPHGLAVEVHE